MLIAPSPARTVFLLDVDNTLLDNDGFTADLDRQLETSFGAAERKRYWAIFEELRGQSGYADYLGTLQRFRTGLESHPALLGMSAFLLEYPFALRIYAHALETIAHLRAFGLPVILSDGDIVFQPRKIQRSGLWEAVQGNVLIDIHKQRGLAAVQARYPAAHYVMVDDKPTLLAEMKQVMGDRLTTVFVRQGHYASAPPTGITPVPDLEILHIGDLRRHTLAEFWPDAPSGRDARAAVR
jgi:FMN phosphatase YigB (HAD superfamily)